ncbi:phage tail spike protein [Bacillus pretiosus]|uniref:Phage tail protein n=1 Tax=Bacillus pretiosus TaxID=2983392 RepID=A0ABT3F0A6_9BACI|nr:phage tail spike protein [Bacillus pretiosus]MCW1241940.1 phage tail protein [Bacillus pretiosus]
MANIKTNNMIIVTDPYGRQKTILTNYLPKTPKFFEDGHLEQLDGLLTYQFSTLASDPATAHLIAGNNVIVRNKDRKLILFTIIRTREERRDGKYVRTVFAENAAIDDLYNHIVDGEELRAVSAQDAATKVLAGTGWQLGMIDYAGLQNVNLHEYPTALAALHQIRDQFGFEMEFTVSFIGTQVREKFVHLIKKRGNNTGKRFTFGKDLTGVTRQVDRSDIATAIIPIGKADENGKHLTIEAFENIHDGYVSPKGQKWVGDDRAMQLYGKGGKHLFKRLDLSGVENEYELMKAAVEELKRVKQPRATYEMSCLLLESLTGYEHEKVRLGDTILVKDTTFDPVLAVQARVISIYRSYTDPSKDYVVLGEFVPLVIDKNKQIEAIQQTINQNMTKWEQGGEVVLKSPNEPVKSKRTPDMLWLDTSAQPNVMKRWDAENNRWVNASATTPEEIGAETPKGAQDKANKAEETAIAEAAEDAAIKAKTAEDKAIEVAEEMDEEIKIELKSYVEGLAEEVEAEVKKHADKKAEDAELNAKLFAEGYAEKEWHYGETPPEDLKQIWFDMSSTPNKIRKYNEKTKQWEAASPTSPKDIGAADQKEVIDAANKARDAAIAEAKTEAGKAKDAAIMEAKQLDESILTESKRVAKEAEDAAKGHTNEVTKQVEEALKKDSQDKANAAKEGALSEADTRILAARQEAEKNAKAEADKLAKAEAKKAQDAAAADAKKKADAAQKAAEDKAAKELADRIAGLSNVGRNLLLGTKGKTHVVKDGAAINHTYFTFVDNAIKDIQGKPLTVSLKMSGKVATIGTTNPWVGMEVRVDYVDGTSQYISGRGEKIIKPNVEYNRLLLSGTGTIFDKPIKSLSAYALARDFTGGTITLEEFKVGIGTMATDYDQPREEELQEVRDTIGSASGQNLALNSAAKLGWLGWSATQAGVNDKWSIGTTGALNGFTHVFRLINKQPSTAENFLINTIPVVNARILGNKVQFGGWVYTHSMSTGGIRFYARFRGKNAAGAEVMRYANAGAENDIRGRGWEWITFEFNDWEGMTSLDEVRITANCLKGSNGEACVTGVMMKVSEVSSQWTPSPLDFEELASDAGVLTKGTLAAERLYGQTIDGNRANFVNLNATNISTGTIHADRIGANSINTSKLQANSVTAEKVAANAVTADKIAANAVNASKIQANSVTADKVAANAITAQKIAANAITADKLHVLAKSLVANTSITGNDSTGWQVSKHATSTAGLRSSSNMGDVLVHTFTTADHDTPTLYHSEFFEVDPNQTYKFSIGMFVEKNEREGSQYFGLQAYDKNQKELPIQPLNPTNGALSGTPRTNPYFWSGTGTVGRWQFMDGYAVAAQSGANEAPQGREIQSSYRLHHATKFLRMRFYSGYYPKAKNKEASILWHSPSVTAVDSGAIVADRISAGTIDANKVNVTNLKANNITSGTMTADRINGGTINAANTNIINLKAGNITSGTIDAAKINVINMNASNITTGMLNVGGTQIAKGTDFMQKGWKPLRASIAHSINENYLITGGAQAKEEFVYLPRFDLNGGGSEKVTLAFEYNVDANYVALPEIFLLASKSPTESLIDSVNHDYVHVLAGGEKPEDIGGNWKRVTKTFTLQNDIKSAVLRLDHNGSKDGKTCNYRYRRVMLNYGSVALTWSPHTEESIGIGAITADKIRAGTITTYKLTVGDFTNLCPNPTFDGGSREEWDRGTVVAATAAEVPKGKPAPTAHVFKQAERDSYCGQYFPVRSGERFWVEAAAATTTSKHEYGVGLQFQKADGTYIWNATARRKPTANWDLVGAEIIVPDGAVRARTFAQINATADFGAWYVTNIAVRRRVDSSLVVDGSIHAGKIAANAITTDKIAANAINASKIAANSIDAGKITAGSITTEKIAAAGITADKITSGILDANRVQVKNLNASVITAGTMSADRITGGTINATNTNIINLKAQNIAGGTINADNVTISNGRVTIGKTGVQVTEADFLVKDAKTGLTHSLQAQTNLIGDHSFEMLSADGDIWNQIYRFINWEFITENDSYQKWARVGSPRMVDGYNTDAPDDASAFGRKAVLVNSSAYVFQDIHAKANKKYSISFHASKPFYIGAGAPQVQVEYLKNGSVIGSEVKNFAIPSTPAGEFVRYGFTITAPATLNHERSNRVRLRFRVNGAEHVLIDGVQAVMSDKPVPYDSEDSIWMMSNARLTPVRMQLRNLMMQGNTRVEGGGLSIAGRNINGVGFEMSEILRLWGKMVDVRGSYVSAEGFQSTASRPAGVDRMLWIGWHGDAGNAIYVHTGGSWKAAVRL